MAGIGAGVMANAQWKVGGDTAPQTVFAGKARPVRIMFESSGITQSLPEVRVRMFQTTSATAVPASETPTQSFHAFPGQTVAGTIRLDFPEVRAETPFLIQWWLGTNQPAGQTEVLVYPTNLLVELKTLAGDQPLGILDPANQFKPLLKKLAMECFDLEDSGPEGFPGRLAIIGPFASPAEQPEHLRSWVEALAKRGVAVVWLQPPPTAHPKLTPSFHVVTTRKGAVVVAHAELVANLADNPRAQFNLIELSRLALNPEPFSLPNTSHQP